LTDEPQDPRLRRLELDERLRAAIAALQDRFRALAGCAWCGRKACT
jgi:hypothetical protein